MRRWLALAVLLFCCSGADCQRRLLWNHPQLPPPILSAQPTLDEIIANVNNNTARVQTLSTQQATLDGPGFPSLRTNLAVEKPRRFRLRALHPLSGPEVDLGSNQDLFWLWIKRSQPPAMYFCSHDQFAGSAMRRMIPVQAEQIVEAFGLATFDTQTPHEGPTRIAPGRLQIRSTLQSPDGALTKLTVVDERAGWVLEQHLYDAAQRHVASVRTSNHYLDALSGAYLPKRIDVEWPVASLAFSIVVERYQVNQPLGEDLWTKPDQPGYQNVNLADPQLLSATPAAAPARR